MPSDWDLPRAGVENEYYLYYFGFNRPGFRQFTMNPEFRYKVELLDTWNMTVEELTGSYQGTFRVDLPGRTYMAVRMTRLHDEYDLEAK